MYFRIKNEEATLNQIQFNDSLRQYCQEMLNEGFTKNQLCSFMLGPQKSPMFSAFLENEDRQFGLKVLSDIFSQFGYELKVVPVKKDSQSPEEEEYFENIYNEFETDYRKILMEALEDPNIKSRPRPTNSGKVARNISSIADDIFQEISQKAADV